MGGMADNGCCPACATTQTRTCWECVHIVRRTYNGTGTCCAPVPFYLAPGRGIITEETASGAVSCESFRLRSALR